MGVSGGPADPLLAFSDGISQGALEEHEGPGGAVWGVGDGSAAQVCFQRADSIAVSIGEVIFDQQGVQFLLGGWLSISFFTPFLVPFGLEFLDQHPGIAGVVGALVGAEPSEGVEVAVVGGVAGGVWGIDWSGWVVEGVYFRSAGHASL